MSKYVPVYKQGQNTALNQLRSLVDTYERLQKEIRFDKYTDGMLSVLRVALVAAESFIDDQRD